MREDVSLSTRACFTENIAAALGAEWKPDVQADGGRWPRIVHADGRGMWLRFESDPKHHIEVHCVWPKGPDGSEHPYLGYQVQAPMIRVSLTKSAAQIAAEIRRRFLPAYEPLFERIKAQRAGEHEYARQQEATEQRLINETGAHKPTNGSHELVWRNGTAGGYIRGCQISGSTVKLELYSVPVDKAIQIINLLHAK